jgi:hypothetical protein
MKASDILPHYIVAALWSSSATVSAEDLALPAFAGYELEIGDDYNLDNYFDNTDLAPKTAAEMDADCAAFLTLVESEMIPLDDWSAEQVGHDFWLTRNGHGAGFWDRGLPEGDALTKAAKSFGGCDLYVGDNGLVYSS